MQAFTALLLVIKFIFAEFRGERSSLSDLRFFRLLAMFRLNRKGSGRILNGSAEGSRDLEKPLAGGINPSKRGEGVLGVVSLPCCLPGFLF